MEKLTALNVYQDFETKMASSGGRRGWRRFLTSTFLLHNGKTFAAIELRELCSFLSLPRFTLVREGGTSLTTLSQGDATCLQETSGCSDLALLQATGFTLSIALSDFKNLLLSSLWQQNLNTQVGGYAIAIPLCRGKTRASHQVPAASVKYPNSPTICISLPSCTRGIWLRVSHAVVVSWSKIWSIKHLNSIIILRIITAWFSTT